MHRYAFLALSIVLFALPASAESWSMTTPTRNSDGTALTAPDALRDCEIAIVDKDGRELKKLPIPVARPLGGEEITVVLSANTPQAAAATGGTFACTNLHGEKGVSALVAHTFRAVRPAAPAAPRIALPAAN